MKYLKYLLTTILVLILSMGLFYKFWFLRQPDRHVPHDNHVFVSPANGVVVSITHWDQDYLKILKKEDGLIKVWARDVDTAGYMVSIQMDPTHVHYQRAPLDAQVLSHQHTSGSYHNALTSGNEYGIRFENEHNEILIQSAEGAKYKIVQIAGFVARRIEDYVAPAQSVKQGDVIGLIKLGSQVTVILPHNVDIKVHKGETTIDGETVIGQIQ